MSNFSFEKAINGEPIYCNGLKICPSFDPNDGFWQMSDLVWYKNGESLTNHDNLTTDPPKKKVKKTVTVTFFNSAAGIIAASEYNKNMFIGPICTKDVEIEVEE